jgi:hypothetical protein
MSRKLSFFLFSLFFLTTASGQSKDLPTLVRQANQLKALDPSCGEASLARSGPPCESFALFACGLNSAPASGKADLPAIQKKYEAALLAYFSKSGPGPILSAIQALGSSVTECSSLAAGATLGPDSSCVRALISALAEKFARTRASSGLVPPASPEGTAKTALDFGALADFLDDESLQQSLREANP